MKSKNAVLERLAGRNAPAMAVALLAVCAVLLLSLFVGAPRAFAYGSFTDVKDNHWVVTEGWLDKVVGKTWMTGYSETKFGPDAGITRGEIATILYRIAEPEATDTRVEADYADNATSFKDNTDGMFFTAAINWASKQGILTGDGSTNYTTVRPNDEVARQELACMVHRFALKQGVSPGDPSGAMWGAPDADAVPTWARRAMAWCYDGSLLTGFKDTGMLCGSNGATRAQVAKVVCKLMDVVAAGRNGKETWITLDSLGIVRDFRGNFNHGDKSSPHQRYIVLHDTEGDGDAASVINWWDGNGRMISSHFVINKDGSIWQCVPVDRIAHHAGYGNPGRNVFYGVTDESRDDKRGTAARTEWLPDYGMNSYSVGIELVHSGNNSYPEAQLKALDKLIAAIDHHFGFQSTIIDHKMWRDGNSDTSPAFAGYLANYRHHRTHS